MSIGKLIRRAQDLFPALVMVLAIGLTYLDPYFIISNSRNSVFDLYQRIKPREYVDPATVAGVGVKHLDIDDASLAKIGQWPWPRTYIAELVARATNAGAYAVVFDIVFAEPDRTSPDQLITNWGDLPELEKVAHTIKQLPGHDDILADVISQANVVTGFTLTEAANDSTPILRAGFSHAGDDPRLFIPRFNGAVTNLVQLEKAAAGNGSFNFITERDNIIRRVPLIVRRGDELYPTLVMETLRVIQGASTYIVKSSGANMTESFGEQTGINAVRVGRIELPTTRTGRLWIHYTKEVEERRIPAWELFSDDFDPKRVAGSVLFVGPSAAGLKDLRATPLSPATAGVEVHIQLLEQILLDHFLSRPDWAQGAELVFLIVLGIIILVLLRRVSAITCAVVAAGGIFFAVSASWYMYANELWLLDPVGPSVTVGLMFISGTLVNFLRTEAEKAQVRGAFSQYLSPALVEQLADEPDRLKLGGETREMTFLFCDIRGFTPISEQFKGNPQGLTHLINRFLTPMTDIILGNEGTIDKYMGDCIMAFWNAPLEDGEQEMNSVASAHAMFKALEELNAEREQEANEAGEKFLPLNIGIGINTGDCVVGNMGSEQRFDYSVLGDAVNLAARLEGQSKGYGVGVVLGPDTAAISDEAYCVLELDLIAVKGKTEAVRIFTTIGSREEIDQAAFEALKQDHIGMLEAYRSQKWDEAEALCQSQKGRLDGVMDDFYDIYVERIAEYRENPPPAEWDGVFVATTK